VHISISYGNIYGYKLLAAIKGPRQSPNLEVDKEKVKSTLVLEGSMQFNARADRY